MFKLLHVVHLKAGCIQPARLYLKARRFSKLIICITSVSLFSVGFV